MKILPPVLLVLLLTSGCDGGLEPTTPPGPAIEGMITFEVAAWPPPDSVVNLWLFVSSIYPLDSSKVFSGILSGSILVFPAPDTSSVTDVRVPVPLVRYFYKVPAGIYPYVGVVQRLRADFNIRSYRVVGVYADEMNPRLPRALTVRGAEVVTNVDIDVRFSQPPPQPF